MNHIDKALDKVTDLSDLIMFHLLDKENLKHELSVE